MRQSKQSRKTALRKRLHNTAPKPTVNEHHQEEDIAGKNLLLVPYLPPYYRFYEVERHLIEKKTSLPDLDSAHIYNRRRQSRPIKRQGKGVEFSTIVRCSIMFVIWK